MKKILSIILVLIFVVGLFSGCSKKDDGEIAYPNTEYTVETDDNGNTTVYDTDGNIIASTESGDDIQIKEDGSVIINSSDGTSMTLPSEATKTETPITKADTSGMDFNFDESDTSANTTPGMSVDVSNNTTISSSGTKLYNITSSKESL